MDRGRARGHSVPGEATLTTEDWSSSIVESFIFQWLSLIKSLTMRCWQNRGELRSRAPVSRGPAQGREEEARVRGETEALYIRTSYFQYDWDVAKFDDFCSFCESFCSEKWHDYQFCCIHIHLFTFIFQFGELIEHHITNGTIVPVEITCSLLERAMTQSDKNNFLIGE